MKISEVMKKVVVAEGNIIVKEAAKIMSDKNISSLVIVDKKNEIIGIISENDITKHFGSGKKVKDIMSTNVCKIDCCERIDEATRLMKENNVSVLPVTQDEKLVGVTCAKDLIKHSDDLNEDFFFD